MRSTISPVRPRRCTTSTTRYRRPRPACMAPSTCSASPSGLRARILQASTAEVYGDPEVHPQTEDYWGHVNPDRAALLLRRGQALRRDAVLRLLAPAPAADQGGAHLQYLWAAHAPQRRPGGLELHRAGAARARHHHLRRRYSRRARSAMSTILSTGLVRADARARTRFTGPDQSRQSGGIHDARARADGDRSHRIEVTRRPPAASQKMILANAGRTSPRRQEVLGWQPKTPLKQGLSKTITYFEEVFRESGVQALFGSSDR